MLGQGNFSRVYLARGRLDGCEYAVKRSCHEVQQESLKKQWVQVGTVPVSFGIRKPTHHMTENCAIRLASIHQSVGHLEALSACRSTCARGSLPKTACVA